MTRYKFFAYLVFLCVFLAWSPLAAQPASDQIIGKVVYLRGAVKAEQPDGTKRHIKFESEILRQDRLITFSDSNVEIKFKDGTLYSQAENSTISLDQYIFSQDPSLSKLLFQMGEGTFRMVTGEIVKQNPEAFELKTPLATIGIRGTEPFATVSSKQETIGVISIDAQHTVEVSSAKNSVSIDKAGMMATVSSDGSVSQPTATPTATQNSVKDAAPMTSLGELGSVGSSKTDMKTKIESFKAHVSAAKGKLGGLGANGDYGGLHDVSVQSSAQSNAEAEASGSGASGSHGGDGGGGGGGSGGGHG